MFRAHTDWRRCLQACVAGSALSLGTVQAEVLPHGWRGSSPSANSSDVRQTEAAVRRLAEQGPAQAAQCHRAVVRVEGRGVDGTGVCVSPAGHVLTAASVVAGNTPLRVRFEDGHVYDAVPEGVEWAAGLALLRLHGPGTFTPARDLQRLLGLAHHKQGMLGAEHARRPWQGCNALEDLLQHDAPQAVNPIPGIVSHLASQVRALWRGVSSGAAFHPAWSVQSPLSATRLNAGLETQQDCARVHPFAGSLLDESTAPAPCITAFLPLASTLPSTLYLLAADPLSVDPAAFNSTVDTTRSVTPAGLRWHGPMGEAPPLQPSSRHHFFGCTGTPLSLPALHAQPTVFATSPGTPLVSADGCLVGLVLGGCDTALTAVDTTHPATQRLLGALRHSDAPTNTASWQALHGLGLAVRTSDPEVLGPADTPAVHVEPPAHVRAQETLAQLMSQEQEQALLADSTRASILRQRKEGGVTGMLARNMPLPLHGVPSPTAAAARAATAAAQAKAPTTPTTCAVVSAVQQGSVAWTAGLRPGQLLLGADGTPLHSALQLSGLLQSRAGPVLLTVVVPAAQCVQQGLSEAVDTSFLPQSWRETLGGAWATKRISLPCAAQHQADATQGCWLTEGQVEAAAALLPPPAS